MIGRADGRCLCWGVGYPARSDQRGFKGRPPMSGSVVSGPK